MSKIREYLDGDNYDLERLFASQEATADLNEVESVSLEGVAEEDLEVSEEGIKEFFQNVSDAYKQTFQRVEKTADMVEKKLKGVEALSEKVKAIKEETEGTIPFPSALKALTTTSVPKNFSDVSKNLAAITDLYQDVDKKYLPSLAKLTDVLGETAKDVADTKNLDKDELKAAISNIQGKILATYEQLDIDVLLKVCKNKGKVAGMKKETVYSDLLSGDHYLYLASGSDSLEPMNSADTELARLGSIRFRTSSKGHSKAVSIKGQELPVLTAKECEDALKMVKEGYEFYLNSMRSGNISGVEKAMVKFTEAHAKNNGSVGEQVLHVLKTAIPIYGIFYGAKKAGRTIAINGISQTINELFKVSTEELVAPYLLSLQALMRYVERSVAEHK